ncbi:MAG: acyl-CoA dehydrogenase [Hyphomicrobiaceae bacterium]|jgi:acyl-CoA dehydrogenase
MIDIRLDEEQLLIRETVTSFAAERIRPAAHDADETGAIPESLATQAWELGLVQGSIPEAYGGYGGEAAAVTGTVVAEGLAEGDLAIALHILSPRLVIDPVLHLGSEAQKKEVLPVFCGEKFVAGSAAVSEPTWNFHITKMATTAKRDGENWVLNGKKCNVPLAKSAPFVVVYATDEDGQTGAFLVRQGTPGMNIGEREKNLGLDALELYEVEFADCRIAAADRLGDDALPMLRRARVAQSAMAVGVAKASLDYAIVYAKDREAFGQKIAQKQAIAFMLANMATETEAARLLNWEAAWHLDSDHEAAREVALAHRYAADMVMEVTDNGLQVLGGHGFVRDHPVELWLRSGRGFAIFEGIASV